MKAKLQVIQPYVFDYIHRKTTVYTMLMISTQQKVNQIS